MKGTVFCILISLLTSSCVAQERCLSIEQSKGTHGKLQEQLERVKTEMNSLYNQTEEFMQYSGKKCVTLDEVKLFAKTIVQLIQKNHGELKADIEQLKNKTCELKADIQQLKNETTGEVVHALGTVENPASSCQQIVLLEPHSLPGYKAIHTPDGQINILYCTLRVPCSGSTLGWTRVALVNMTDASQTCPPGLRKINTTKRSCGRTNLASGGCSSVTFDSHGLSYSKICGKIIGYQFGSPSGFHTPNISGKSIESVYLEGVSLTHGTNPRKHIWSFANALGETVAHGTVHACPCSNPRSTMQQFIPTVVGTDYFCDSGIHTSAQVGVYYDSDPLWDGAGCESPSTCCSFNNPPWFYKQLSNITNDSVEMRICADEDAARNEDSPVELIEIYVQ